MSEHVVVLVTTSSQAEAEKIAEALVRELLAACVNIVPEITSVYRWQGQVEHAQEWLLIAKSQNDVLEALIRRVQALHSYQVPEVIALPLSGGSREYLNWIDGEVHGDWHTLS